MMDLDFLKFWWEKQTLKNKTAYYLLLVVSFYVSIKSIFGQVTLIDIYDTEYEDIVEKYYFEKNHSYEEYYEDQEEEYSFSPDWSNNQLYTECREV